MTKSNYLKNYAESFAIFAKYEPHDMLDLEYYSIGVFLTDGVSAEDDARLVELGWREGDFGGYYKDECGKNLEDYS